MRQVRLLLIFILLVSCSKDPVQYTCARQTDLQIFEEARKICNQGRGVIEIDGERKACLVMIVDND